MENKGPSRAEYASGLERELSVVSSTRTGHRKGSCGSKLLKVPRGRLGSKCHRPVLASVALHVVLLVRCDLGHAGTEHDVDPISSQHVFPRRKVTFV